MVDFVDSTKVRGKGGQGTHGGLTASSATAAAPLLLRSAPFGVALQRVQADGGPLAPPLPVGIALPHMPSASTLCGRHGPNIPRCSRAVCGAPRERCGLVSLSPWLWLLALRCVYNSLLILLSARLADSHHDPAAAMHGYAACVLP
jgi:hypothetical protein